MKLNCRGNGTRNMYTNYDQMKTSCECYSNQPRKLYVIDIFIEEFGKTLKVTEKCWLALYLNFTRVFLINTVSPHT